MTALRAGGRSDVGRVRANNEDRLLLADDLFAVADGLGGHQAGETASQTAVDTLRAAFSDRTVDGLLHAVEVANQAVWQLASSRPELRGMATTLTAIALVSQDGEDQLALVNVGDSRAYLLQRNELTQITEDHSMVEELVREGRLTPQEASVHPQRSVITRALGLGPDVEVDNWELIPYRGDRVLLCSDGLTGHVSDDAIASTLRTIDDPDEAAAELVRAAREGGGSDNITVVVVDIVDDDDRSVEASAALQDEPTRAVPVQRRSAPPPADETRVSARPAAAPERARARPDEEQLEPRPRRFTWRVALFLVVLLLVVGGALAAVDWYARHTYYVGVGQGPHAGEVVLYRGRPGGLLWFDPTFDKPYDLHLTDLLASDQNDVRAGHTEATRADADRYVSRLREKAAEAHQPGAPAPTPSTTAAPPIAPPTSHP